MPGASGIIAHQAVARAPADGYTLLFTNTSGMAINLISFKQLAYDPERDFTPVAMVCSLGPQMLSVNAELPAEDAGGVHRLRQGQPRQALDGLRHDRGRRRLRGPADQQARRSRHDRGALSLGGADGAGHRQRRDAGDDELDRRRQPVVQAGKVRRIAITSAKRFPGLPDLPAVARPCPAS